jgi:hypothetical protein
MNTQEFIEQSISIHGYKYDYSKVDFVKKSTDVIIVCPKHGEFTIRASDHLRGRGCAKCANNQTLTTDEFIERAINVHGNKFDYSKVRYVNSKTEVCIICPIHGETWQKPCKHLKNKYGCYKCSIKSRADKRKLLFDGFVKKARKIHGDKYDYSNVKYENNRVKVCIICPKHGEFWQTPDDHFTSFGCSLCANEHRAKSKTKSLEHVIEEFKNVHGNKYDYSKVKYNGCFENVCIICPKHGEFWQTPDNHLHGRGCPICNESKLEKNVREFLYNANIEYVPQKTYEWLINKKQMKLDFYLPQYNIAIECQGLQHFNYALNTKYGWFDGEKDLSIIKENIQKVIDKDNLKRKLCEEHGIKIFYFSNLGIEYPYEVYEDLNIMIEDIKKYAEQMRFQNGNR